MISTQAGASRRSSFAKTARSEKQTLQARTTARARLRFGPASATPPPVASATPATMGASVAYVVAHRAARGRFRAKLGLVPLTARVWVGSSHGESAGSSPDDGLCGELSSGVGLKQPTRLVLRCGEGALAGEFLTLV